MRFATLCSGSSGNAAYIEAGDNRLLIDAGVSCRRICKLLEMVGGDARLLSGILVTHEHTDHINGINVLSKKYDLPVFANAECWRSMMPLMSKVLASNIRVFESDKPFMLGETKILPFTTMHDAIHPVAYVIEHRGSRIAVMTDIGHIDKRLLGILEGCKLVLIEANHDVDMLMAGSYPYQLKKRILSGKGHLCNEDCGETLAILYQGGLRNAILGHLSSENNDPMLARATVLSILESHGISDMNIVTAGRDAPSPIFEV
ncbi:MAG TPA: MBL fold metallo-hydrolase [Clostridia bacterium]|nr:MBL fold metallo-hydrolase [Clostridia bacterium]